MELPKHISREIDQRTKRYKLYSILPPSDLLAQTICGMANMVTGGFVLLGVKVGNGGTILVKGLSSDFVIPSILEKSLARLRPQPSIESGYYTWNDKQVYLIEIKPAAETVTFGSVAYRNENGVILDPTPAYTGFRTGSAAIFQQISREISRGQRAATNAKSKVLDHFQHILLLMSHQASILLPHGPDKVTNLSEGKVMNRLLVCSICDNLEIYLSDLLFEIWLANPDTLKSNAPVTVEEVLNCSDREEFIKFYAHKRLAGMSKGSIKEFIKDNNIIKELQVILPEDQKEMDKRLQVRHLYTHRNGFVDEKFKRHFPLTAMGAEYVMSVDEILEYINYFIKIIDKVDEAAVRKHSLATT